MKTFSITTFSNWLNSLQESAKNTYSRGCVMAYYQFPQIESLHNQIDKSDLYEDQEDPIFGLEKEPHTTILYGFGKRVDGSEVLDLCDSIVSAYTKFKPIVLKLKEISVFENESYDVLKFNVVCPVLHEINEILKAEYSGEYKNEYPDYHPHCTIAYLKKGKGQHYVDLFKNESYEVYITSLVYSTPKGDKLVRAV